MYFWKPNLTLSYLDFVPWPLFNGLIYVEEVLKNLNFSMIESIFGNFASYLFSSNLEVEAWVLNGVVFSFWTFEGSLDDVRFTSEVCWFDTFPLLFILLSKTNGEFLGWNGGRVGCSPKKGWKFRFIFDFSEKECWKHSLITIARLMLLSSLLLLSLLVLLSTHPTGWWFTLISLIAEKTNPKALGNHENHWLHITNT